MSYNVTELLNMAWHLVAMEKWPINEYEYFHVLPIILDLLNRSIIRLWLKFGAD